MGNVVNKFMPGGQEQQEPEEPLTREEGTQDETAEEKTENTEEQPTEAPVPNRISTSEVSLRAPQGDMKGLESSGAPSPKEETTQAEASSPSPKRQHITPPAQEPPRVSLRKPAAEDTATLTSQPPPAAEAPKPAKPAKPKAKKLPKLPDGTEMVESLLNCTVQVDDAGNPIKDRILVTELWERLIQESDGEHMGGIEPQHVEDALVYSLTPATTTIYADSPLYSALQHLIGVFVRASDKLDEFNELRSRIVNQHEPSEALSQWLSDLDQSGTICRDITDAAAKVAASVIVNGPLTRPHFPVEGPKPQELLALVDRGIGPGEALAGEGKRDWTVTFVRAVGKWCLEYAGEEDTFYSLCESLITKAHSLQYKTQYQSLLPKFIALTRSSHLCAGIAKSPLFLPPFKPDLKGRLTSYMNGNQLEKFTLLGCLFNIEVVSSDMARTHFSNMRSRTVVGVEDSNRLLRNELGTVYKLVHSALSNFVKAKGAHDQTINWIRALVYGNMGRLKTFVDRNTVSNYPVIMNTYMALLELSMPFARKLNMTSSVDVGYLSADHMLYREDEPMLMRTGEEETKDSEGEKKMEDFNFITKGFFLTCRMLQLSLGSMIRQHEQTERHRMHAGRLARDNPSNPMFSAQEDQLLTARFVLESVMLDPQVLAPSIQFIIFAGELLATYAMQGEVPPAEAGEEGNGAGAGAGAGAGGGSSESVPAEKQGTASQGLESAIQVPFHAVAPTKCPLQRIPESIVDDMLDVLNFTARSACEVVNALDASSLDSLFKFLIGFLSAPHYVRSPHLRAKFGQIFYDAFLPVEERPGYENEKKRRQMSLIKHSVAGERLMQDHPLARKYLVPCLMLLYGDVEHTGHEKISNRFKIAAVLNYLWKFPSHRPAFEEFCSRDRDFVVFANGILNHSNETLSSALSSIPTIKEISDLMANQEAWNKLSEEEQREKEKALGEAEGLVTDYLMLANQTTHLLEQLSAEVAEPFLRKELISRLVAMLFSVISTLNGAGGKKLKLADPSKYNFNPRLMLQRTIKTLLNFSSKPGFRDAVLESFYYDDAALRKALKAVKAKGMLDEKQVEVFETFANEVKSAAEAKAAEEEELGEAPEDFLDPILYHVMEDPVRLPSGHIADRSTVEQHILNSNKNIFTRDPLTIEELEPLPELKARIEAWKSSKGKSEQHQSD